MKTKITRGGRGLLVLMAVLCAVCLVYFSVNALLGEGEWFRLLFIRQADETYRNLEGNLHTIYGEFLRWESLRSFLAALAAAVTLLWGLSLAAVVWLSRRSHTRSAARQSAALVREVFSREEGGTVVVPKEYDQVAAAAKDLREQMQRSEEALQHEATRRNDLIAYLAHDLKTPLTSVIGYLSLLEEVPEMPTEQRAKYVRITLDKALRLETLINEFFEITRYNLHEILLETRSVDLPYLLEQLTEEFYPLLQDQNNRITLAAEPGLAVTADPEKLARVFNNLLKNAIAYSHPGTPISIRAWRQEDRAVITVTNSGRTIPAQKLTAIFEKFYRVDVSRATRTGGAGLGLAIAKEIVTAHGGTITAASADGQTTFTVELPLQ